MFVFCKLLLIFIILKFSSYNADAAVKKGKTWVIASSSYDGGTDGLPKYPSFQGSVYKTYQLFRAAGIPDENMILFANDDIAYSRSNPFPGVVYYGTTSIDNATNYYDGVKVDYYGEACKGHTFLNVLSGKKNYFGKTLESGPNDTIILLLFHFMYFGSIVFGPYGKVDFIEPHQIISAIDDLYDRKRFKKMLIYSENSYSTSSSFEGYLDANKNILAITAGGHNRYAYFCDRNDVLKHETSLCRTRLFFDYITKLRKGNYEEGKTFASLLKKIRKFIKFHKEYKFQVHGNLGMLEENLQDYFGTDLSDPNKYSNSYNPEGLKNPKPVVRLEDLSSDIEQDERSSSTGNSIRQQNMFLGHIKHPTH